MQLVQTKEITAIVFIDQILSYTFNAIAQNNIGACKDDGDNSCHQKSPADVFPVFDNGVHRDSRGEKIVNTE